MSAVAIIPARYDSTRLPGKPLAHIHGKTLIERVHERVRLARRVGRVIVATDDERIAAAVRAFGGEVAMTSTRHATGTDRIAEAAAGLDDSIVANVQGDEPLLDPGALDAAVEALVEDLGLSMSTISCPFADPEEALSPSAVKVLTDASGNALYFSRAPIPHVRGAAHPRAAAALILARSLARRHVGLYVYRREVLLRFASLPPAPLEEAEGLEQLRALHHGIRIRVVPREQAGGPAVDTPQDLARVREMFAASSRPGTGV